MLVLTQREGDTTRLKLEDGREITATTTLIKGGQVKVSWSAPKTISILRDDARVRAQKEKTAP